MKTVFSFLLVSGLLFASCKSSTSSSQRENCDAARFAAVIDSAGDEQLLDVRTTEEFNEGHLQGSINIDWNGNDFAAATASLDKNRPVLVYCRSGNRSGKAAEWLQNNGFKNVYQLDGGIKDWEAAGLPVVTGTIGGQPSDGQPSTSHDGPFTTASYAAIVNKEPVVLADFGATWCGPCKMLAPRLAALEQEMPGKFVLLKVDADRDAHLADSMNVTALPTLFLYKNGKLVWRNEGLVPKETVADAINNK